MHAGLLILRLAIGLPLAAHGAQKLLGMFGGHGLAGTGGFLESLGFRPGRRAAEIAGVTEVAGGLLIALGLLTPLASAAIIGVMVVAAVSAHWGRGFFSTVGGWELNLMIAAGAAAIAFTGPGVVSLDRLLDLDLGGNLWGALALVIGGSAAGVQLSTRTFDGDDAEIDIDIDLRDVATEDETATDDTRVDRP